MVFLQGAARETSPSGACITLVERGQVILCLSPAVVAEVTEVLSRPLLQRKFKQLTPERVKGFLRKIQDKAVIIADVPAVFSYPRDPDDEPYINLALAAGVRYLVSRDNDLLDLMKDSDFRTRYPDLTILDPVALLQELSRKHQTEPAPEPRQEQPQEGTQSQGIE
jgi:putative PIN family toxin of toxin-antitoxin system